MRKEIKGRARKRSELFRPVLDQVRLRIKRAAALDQLRIIFRVPEFVPGLPRYDTSEVADMVADVLRCDGFVVDVYPPDTIYVSWDKAEAG
jgi:hypothetical protein